jgi:hypothetical protein
MLSPPDVRDRSMGRLPASTKVTARSAEAREGGKPATTAAGGAARLRQGSGAVRRSARRRKAGRYDRMNANTSSRFSSIIFCVFASRFSRSIGSVFEPRTLKCQSGNSAEKPSSV